MAETKLFSMVPADSPSLFLLGVSSVGVGSGLFLDFSLLTLHAAGDLVSLGAGLGYEGLAECCANGVVRILGGLFLPAFSGTIGLMVSSWSY